MESAIGEFGRRLRQLREARGLTQRQLADPYFTHAYVSTIESGRRFPSERALAHFAGRLGIDPDQLKTGRPPTLESDIELGLVEARRLISEGSLRQAQARLTDLRKQTRDYGLSHSEARAINGLALCSERKGELVEAGEMYLTAQRMLASEPLTFSVEAICGEARCLMLQGDIRFAIHRLETTVAALEKQGLQDPSAMLRLNSSLVGPYFELGLHPRAYQCAEEALRLAPYVEDRERLALAYLNVAWALNHEGRDKDARDVLQRASFLFDELDLKLELARAQQARGMLLARQTKRRAARSELIRAKEVFAHANSPVDLARTLNELGRLERLGGRLDAARQYLTQAIELLEHRQAPAVVAWAYREMALVQKEESPEETEKLLLSSIELFVQAQEATELATTYRILGDFYRETGEETRSCEAYRIGIVALEGGM